MRHMLFSGLVGAVLTLAGAMRRVEAQSESRFFGDFRVRYENTANQDDLPARGRGVLRFRAGLVHDVSAALRVGARVATGDPDDPNSTDVTMGDFVDDVEVSLDQLYVELRRGGLFATAGKFANPFLYTELVWDGDVNPQGIAGRYTISSSSVTATLGGAFCVVDEQSSAPDSYMVGGQGAVLFRASPEWRIQLAAGYYDYEIRSLVSADAGDTRGNYLLPDQSAFLSDFDLLDVVGTVEHSGFGSRFPIRLVANYVKNVGAVVNEDDGFGADLFVGRAAEPQDLRFRYGYSWAQTDAVLAAFSHDNTTMATNYRQHTFTLDYVVVSQVMLNATWYLYRRDRLGTTPTTDSGQLVSRLRLNAQVAF